MNNFNYYEPAEQLLINLRSFHVSAAVDKNQ
jgi:hypothetical protein